MGFVPLVGEGGELVWGYSEADVTARAAGVTWPALSYATRRVIALDGDAPLIEALGLMVAYRVRRVPVLGAGAPRLAYINDLLHALASGRARGPEPLRSLGLPEAPTAPAGVTVGEAAHIIARTREKALLLVEGGRLAAIITERDVAYAYAAWRGCRG